VPFHTENLLSFPSRPTRAFLSLSSCTAVLLCLLCALTGHAESLGRLQMDELGGGSISRSTSLGQRVIELDELGPPFQISKHPSIAPMVGFQRTPALVSNGTGYFAAWADERSGSTRDVYGTRIDATGTVMDVGGIRISGAGRAQPDLAVAYDGVNYLVVWSDTRGGDSDIYGARVSSSGAVLDPGGIAISTAAYNQSYPAISFDGTNYLIVWVDTRTGNNDIYATRVSSSGVVLDPGGIPISRDIYTRGRPAVAFGGTNYLVVWENEVGFLRLIHGKRVSLSGTLLDYTSIQIGPGAGRYGYQTFPAVAFNGVDYVVVWNDLSHPPYDIRGIRVTQTGHVLDSSYFWISNVSVNLTEPAIASAGSACLVTWQDSGSGSGFDIFGMTFDQTGQLVDSTAIAVSASHGDQILPQVAACGVDWLVTWQDARGDSGDIYGTRVSSLGLVVDTDGILITAIGRDQRLPDVAFDGANYLAVWEDFRNGDSDIYGARVTEFGHVLDPDGIAISAAAQRAEVSPVVGFDGTNYFVVWAEESGGRWDIYGARVGTTGEVLDSSGIAVSTAASFQRFPDMAFDGENYLVVWCDHREGSMDIYGARVSPSGTVLDPGGIGIAVSATVGLKSSPSVAFDGTHYLVIWEGWRSQSQKDIYGTRVAPSGAVLDVDGKVISAASNDQASPGVEWDGTNFLAVWEDSRNGHDRNIYAARISPSGQVLDPQGVEVSNAHGDQRHVALAFDGTHHFVVWTDERGGSLDIYGTRVMRSGIVLEPDGIPLSAAGDLMPHPAVCRGSSFSLLLVYQLSHDTFFQEPYSIWGNSWRQTLSFSWVSITGSSGCLELSWGMRISAAESDFVIQRSDTPLGQRVFLDASVSKLGEHMFSSIDCTVQQGRTYWYWIVFKGPSGEQSYGPIEVFVERLPAEHSIRLSYPNPFRKTCTIRFEMPRPGKMSLKIFDVSGSLVRTLLDGWKTAGVYSEVWDGAGRDGQELSPGIYFCRLESDAFVAVHKIVLLY